MFKFLTFVKRKVIIKAYFESQFKYYLFVWMFHGRLVNNNINRLHERALMMIYKDSNSSFDTLLEKDISFSVHDRNIQQLALKMHKLTKDLAPATISRLFLQCSDNRNTR